MGLSRFVRLTENFGAKPPNVVHEFAHRCSHKTGASLSQSEANIKRSDYWLVIRIKVE